MGVIPWLTLAGVVIYVGHLVWEIGRGVFRGEISGHDIDAAIRRSIDGATYDGSYGTRDGQVWCELCHRYHSA